MVPNFLLCLVDSYVCHLPMDHPCLCFTSVAIPISRLVIPICSCMVLIGGIVAYSMLCYLCIGYKIEMLLAVEMVSSVIPVPKVKIGLGIGSRNRSRIISSSCLATVYKFVFA
eukprot:TRINITY_DN2241_c0_g1_i11.p1 TRINITY_DN2241_c0_g1~~TRINITY_DN2241_c0_g1_i11.p1  ORF type:complete len:113 (+),score=6.60 TRINITY_DN2241_c0_g1_i11:1008-1346(+)